MNELNYQSVNIDAKTLEEQNENLKKPNNEFMAQKLVFNEKNYLNLRLNQNELKKSVKIRLLPISSTDGTVFFNIHTHALKVNKEVAKSGFKTYVCLNNENLETDEKCPICQKSQELFAEAAKARDEGNEALSKTLFKTACSFKKKRTFIVRVIDRDHEDEGVKFWRFNENSKGEGIYDKLMSLYNIRNEESIKDGLGEYNIFDLYQGKDIIIDVSKAYLQNGRETIAYNITDSGNRKPLSLNIEQANQWLNDPKTWKDVYSFKKADYLKIVIDGKVPVFNKDLGKFVAKAEQERVDEIEQQKVAADILKGNIDASTTPNSIQANHDNQVNMDGGVGLDDYDNDLPF